MEADLDFNRELILAHERRFAGYVAGEVVDKPVLAMWMILIPVFFVFYFYQLKRYKSGLKEFSRNFLVTRKQALDSVCEASRQSSSLDIDELAARSDSPIEVRHEYRLWVEALVDHFQTLIEVPGSSYEELVRNGYRKKSSYQGELDRLNRTELELSHALTPHLPGDKETIETVIKSMQDSVKRLRQSQSKEIFS